MKERDDAFDLEALVKREGTLGAKLEWMRLCYVEECARGVRDTADRLLELAESVDLDDAHVRELRVERAAAHAILTGETGGDVCGGQR